MKTEKQYIDLFEQQREVICRNAPEVMNSGREAAFEAFRSVGFPSRKSERYRYTDIARLFAPDYGLNLARLDIPVNPYDTFRCYVPNLSTALYFVVNDSFYSAVQPKAQLPDGVVVGSLRDVAAKNPELVGRYYNRLAKDEEGVCALNTMLAQDGVFVYVPRNVKVERPVQIINILHSAVDLMANRRVLVVLEEGAELNMLVCDHAGTDREFLSTQVMEIFVGENASLDITCLEETHVKNRLVGCTYIEQQAWSRVNHNAITLHNGVTRNQLDLRLAGEGAECWCSGCAVEDKEQHVDNNTIIDHAVGHCQSHELYKYVLNDASTGAFAGRVLVRKDAQKTASAMTNQNICATKQARMYTQPMLEIYADDVKCSHGSTVGQLNDAALFYMRQRGVPEKEAKTLLQVAFVTEVINSVRLQPLRERLQYLVEKRFRGELNKCEGCSLCL